MRCMLKRQMAQLQMRIHVIGHHVISIRRDIAKILADCIGGAVFPLSDTNEPPVTFVVDSNVPMVGEIRLARNVHIQIISLGQSHAVPFILMISKIK